MRSIALLVVIAACGSYYYLHRQPAPVADTAAPVQPMAAASVPPLYYHSPLDPSNGRRSSGYYSTAPAEHYEVTGPRATSSSRAALARSAAAQTPPAAP